MDKWLIEVTLPSGTDLPVISRKTRVEALKVKKILEEMGAIVKIVKREAR